MATTKKPTGLVIKRNERKFVTTWKIADADYKDGQQLKRRLTYSDSETDEKTHDPDTVETLGRKPENTYTLDVSKYFPTTTRRLHSMTVWVRGNRDTYTSKGKRINPTWSKWAKYTFNIEPPDAPTTSATFERTNQTTFKATPADEKDNKPYTRMRWESVLVENAGTTDGAKVKWGIDADGWEYGFITSKEESTVFSSAEQITPNPKQSFTRFVRVRSEGIGGASEWQYMYHVYGVPKEPLVIHNKVEQSSGNVTLLVMCTTPSNDDHPIDAGGVGLQYLIDVPAVGLTPRQDPSTELPERDNTANIDQFYYELGTAIPKDQCLFYRMTATHDNNTSYSSTYLRYVGYLQDPTNVTITPNWSNMRVRVQATNESEVPDAFLAVLCKVGTQTRVIGASQTGQGAKDFTVAIPSDATEADTAFGVEAVVGTVSGTSILPYSGKIVMHSENVIWQSGSVPKAPANVSVTKAEVEETVLITWEWTWDEADSAEITWSDNPLAWESNEEPSEYIVSNINPSHWYITGLEEGKVWYFKVRQTKTVDDVTHYSAWSERIAFDLRSAPNKPTLMLSDSVITADGMTKAYWAYVTTDGTPQSYAELCEATIVGGQYVYGEPFDQVASEQHIDIYAKDRGWSAGEKHLLCVRVMSASGITSEGWSDPVALNIASELTATITSDSLVAVDLSAESGGVLTGTEYRLTQMPLTVTVTGAGAGQTTVAIVRASDYMMDRPDETEYTGHKGEMVALVSQYGESAITIDSLIGYLDDGADYEIVATVKDSFGQSAEVRKPFTVRWNHQAVKPNADVVMDGNAALIIPRLGDVPSGWQLNANDRVDIYRLSSDRPELVYRGAELDVGYVDPYPAIGGGYRVVFKTKDGDYIAQNEDGETPAWSDIESGFTHDRMIIDFGGDSVELYYNVDEDDSWSKDFTQTKYLGGHITGDWNLGVERSADVSAVVITIVDDDTVDALRRLAEYAGAVHVRTLGGSSYTANVDVKRSRSHDHYGTRYSYSLSIQRVDSQGFDGVALDFADEYSGISYMEYESGLAYLLDRDGNYIVDENGARIVVKTGGA